MTHFKTLQADIGGPFLTSEDFWVSFSTSPTLHVRGTRKADDIAVDEAAASVELFGGNDVLDVNAPVFFIHAGAGSDTLTVDAEVGLVDLGIGSDSLTASAFIHAVLADAGNDVVSLGAGAGYVSLGSGNDTLSSAGFVASLFADLGNDSVTLLAGGGEIDLGNGNDALILGELVDFASGGRGKDSLTFTFDAGQVDLAAEDGNMVIIDRLSGHRMEATGFETIAFADRSFSAAQFQAQFAEGALPTIFADGTIGVTVNNIDPTVSVIWDRVVQLAVTETRVGPTVGSRAYAMLHTAMYDAWAAYDATAVRVSFDAEGDNAALEALAVSTIANKEKAMSFAALTLLTSLFIDDASFNPAVEARIEAIINEVMTERLGFSLESDGSIEAQIGIDAAEDLIALRLADGANQPGRYVDTTGYTPVNPNPLEINDITKWTPENVPVDPEDASPEQRFLTPHWENVQSFALDENGDGTTDFTGIRPEAPEAFFADDFAGSTLDVAAKTITLSAAVTIEGIDYAAGDVIAVSKALIGTVINADFIAQAEEVVSFSANLDDEQKIIAEFFEDGGGTAFPPGTWMTYAQFVSGRDGHSIDDDAKLFLAMGNAVMDAGIATWEAKVFYDYARPVRVIRELGELGLIGEPGTDELTGETGHVIRAFGGWDPETGIGYGTRTILAENFVTYQLPGANPSPPFSEHTSGHSAFSAAGAEVLRQFTGSDSFGAFVTFAPESTLFDPTVPELETTLLWETFSVAADQAGLSRLYGGIHFTNGDQFGRLVGQEAGSDAYALAQSFINGTATDEDRPFFGDFLV